MKSRKTRSGPGGTLGSSAQLLMLGSIDACRPRRKRSRGGLVSGMFWLMLLATLGVATWLIVDGFRRGIIPTSLI